MVMHRMVTRMATHKNVTLALVPKPETVFVQGGGGGAQAQAVLPAEGEIVDNIDDNHAEAQGDDGQIVSLEPQGGDAHQQAHQGGEQSAGQDAGEEDRQEDGLIVVRKDRRPLTGQAQKGGSVGADGHKAAVAQGQLA